MATNIYEEELRKAKKKQERKIAQQEAQLNLESSIPSSAPRFGSSFNSNVTSAIQSAAFNKRFRGGKRSTASRAIGARRLLQGVGAIPTGGRGQGAGAGRPKGTYKYGIPIQQYKKLLAQRKALAKGYAAQTEDEFAQRGFTPEQIQQLQYSRMNSQQVSPDPAMDELQFQKFVAENTITPNTQAILDNLKRIQNKAQTDDLNQQRVHRERKLVNEQQSLLKARNLFGPDSNKFNALDMNDNILLAPNVFANENSSNVFTNNGRPNILQTREAGNQLFFG